MFRCLRRDLRVLIRDRGGNVGIIFGLSLLPLVGLSGMAIDYSRASAIRAAAQAAMDSAVLSAVAQPA